MIYFYAMKVVHPDIARTTKLVSEILHRIQLGALFSRDCVVLSKDA